MDFSSRYELHQIISQAIRITARKLGIKDTEWKFMDELLDEIQNKNKVTSGLLNEFLNAYTAWFTYCEDCQTRGRNPADDSVEKEKYMALIQDRNSTRDKILEHFKQLE